MCVRESVKSERVGFHVYTCVCTVVSLFLFLLFVCVRSLARGDRRLGGLKC